MNGPAQSNDKQTLRQIMRQKTQGLPMEEALFSSEKITAAVLASDLYRQAHSLFIYVSVGKEPDTRRLIRHALQAGKTVYVPKCLPGHTLQAVAIDSLNCLTPGALGIPEPPAGERDFPAAGIDLAIVPCVAASLNGGRLGHGAGYYDRFLAAHPLPTLCLCHAQLLLPDLPMTPQDVPMDYIATAGGIHRCGE
ncbi:MAG: 5-formyltetrahydrofolate cyclo-ligase [Clostridia bacterium]|nr:5-formyltetrahydrofolate cyclo-ligase [Clostridia bacterium]